MGYEAMRKELTTYYFTGTGERGEEFRERANAVMDAQYTEGMNPYVLI